MEDVTTKLLSDLRSALGKDASRLRKVKPASLPLSESLLAVIKQLQNPRNDNTLGFISNALAYSSHFRSKPKKYQDDIVRLLKAGVLLVIKVVDKPPHRSFAEIDTPYGTSFYNIEINPELM